MATAFRYFWLFFRADAFRVPDEGEGLPFLDGLLEDSRSYAKALGENLKKKVFGEIFDELASGFVAGAPEGTATDASALHEVYQGTLTLMYRLLFLLYAEARELLPVRETRDYYDLSLTRIKEEIAAAGGSDADARDDRLAEAFSPSAFTLWDRLLDLFAVIDRGRDSVNVPPYNGGLFITDPADIRGERHELDNARFLATRRISDLQLARALDRLSRDIDDKCHELVFVDYKSLGVRQLGSIYEGLLEYRLQVAEVDLGIVRENRRDVAKPLTELSERARAQAIRQGAVVSAGAVYLAGDKGERRATGSYYTPDYIVKYIVEHTVGPVIEAKLEALRPQFREAQRWHAESKARAAATKDRADKYDRGTAVEQAWGGLIDAFFDLRVLDPAMGSGHFLVEAVDFITDRMLRFLTAFPWNPVTARLEATRQEILKELESRRVSVDPKRLHDVNLLTRQVLKRCIYGVDLNPMAVELAKVSLWLHCFTLGAPLSFLDHHLRWGNSLVGATIDEVENRMSAGQINLFGGSQFEGMKQAVAGMIRVGVLSDITPGQVAESRAAYQDALAQLLPAKRVLDVYTSQWFSNPTSGKGRRSQNPAEEFMIDPSILDWARNPTTTLPEYFVDVAERAVEDAASRRFFHWEMEFPEIFFGPEAGTTQKIVRLADGGFDAIVGNPPYVRVQELKRADPPTVAYLGARYGSAIGNFDLYLPFFERALSLSAGRVGFIAQNKWFDTDYGRGLRSLVAKNRHLQQIVDFQDHQVFDGATTYAAIVLLHRDAQQEFVYVDASSGQIGSGVTLSADDIDADGGSWAFGSTAEMALLKRLRGPGFRRLGDYLARAFQGIRTSDNGVYVLDHIRDLEGGLVEAHSVALDAPVRLERALLKPLAKGADIRAFRIAEPTQWLLFPYELRNGRVSLLREAELRERFPEGWQYLVTNEARLRAREKGKMDGARWWAYVYPKNLDQFEQPKIMLPDYNSTPSAAFDEAGQYYSVTAYSVTLQRSAPISLAALTALLNCSLWFHLLKLEGTELRGGYVRFMPQYLRRLPVPVLRPDQVEILEKLTELAMIVGPAEVQAELDQCVAEMYDLSRAELQSIFDA